MLNLPQASVAPPLGVPRAWVQVPGVRLNDVGVTVPLFLMVTVVVRY